MRTKRRTSSPVPSIGAWIASLGLLWASVVLMLLVCLLLGGCAMQHPSHDRHDRVLWVDDCKYLAFRNDRTAIIVHAGDCPNPVHRRVDTVYMGVDQTIQTGGRP